jgi:hypothetical protein
VTWQQAAFGIIAAALITIAYIVLYPRSGDRVTETPLPDAPSPKQA